MPLQIEFVPSLESNAMHRFENYRLKGSLEFGERNRRVDECGRWMLRLIRVIWLITASCIVSSPLKRETVRSTYFSISDRKGELGRNEISREGLFVLNYKYPRFERRKDPCVLSGFPVLYHLDSPFTDL